MSTETPIANGTRAAIDRAPKTGTRTRQTSTTAGTTAGATATATSAETTDTGLKTPRIAEAAHRAVDTVAAQVAEAERRLRDSATDNQDALKDVAGQATEKASEVKDRTREYINNHPLAAAGIAFAAGIVFSAWMRR